MAGINQAYDAAVKAQDSSPAEAISQHRAIVLGSFPNDADSVKVKENSIMKLAELYAAQKDAQSLRKLLSELRPLFAAIPKAKTAKLVRALIDAISKVPNSTQLQLDVCREQVEWATAEKRTFLRQRIEARLANLHLESRDFTAALALIGKLLTEVKKLDDKLLLVEVHLLESRAHHALRNLPKAKAALTAARAAANSIYIPPSLQSEIDTQSGILHAEERDYKTAYSYFYEAFEALNTLESPEAVGRLKYMLLCKIMTSKSDAEDVPSTISSKAGIKYAGEEVDSMAAVAKAYADRSLHAFQAALDSHPQQLVQDPVTNTHLQSLYGTLLEQNLTRLIEPFSRVEIAHVAQLIQLPVATVEGKLSQMILDGKLAGTLDAGAGCLDIFEDASTDSVYAAALDSLQHMGNAIDTLALRSQKVLA